MHVGFKLSDEEAVMLNKIKQETGKSTAAVFKNAIYFKGLDEDLVDEIISNIGTYADEKNLDGIKEEVYRYVVYRTRR